MGAARLSRRQFLQLTLGGGVLVGANLPYAAWIEPRGLSIERVTVSLPRLPAALDGLTIAQLSDFHVGLYVQTAQIQAAVNAANALRPDLVVLTGDYIFYSADEHAWPCALELGRLHAPLGVYAVLGNHDYWGGGLTVVHALELQAITVLRNRAVAIEQHGARLWLAGVDDVWMDLADMERTLRGIPRDEAILLLAHEPDYADFAARFPIDLQLSGHSHGGQVRIPFLGPVVLPYLGQKYVMGLQQVGALQVYTTRGIGLVPPAVRWNCPPEVTLLTLVRGT